MKNGPMNSLRGEAERNLARLKANPYPGRGIVLGRSEDGSRLLQIYWIMGRSANSRNRIFAAEGGTLRTRALDPERMENPQLVIYTAMDSFQGEYVVTNGDHTDTVLEALRSGGDYREALRTRKPEPDAPHYTPRIAGGIRATGGSAGSAWLALIKADPGNAAMALRFYFEMETLPPGLGWCITTYRGEGQPLPPFSGEPYPLPLDGDPERLPGVFWDCLNAENRVALALKIIDPDSGEEAIRIVNAYQSP